MWYTIIDKSILDLTKPICCVNSDKEILLLVPQLSEKNCYAIKGYNWLNLVTGRYQSSSFFPTAQAACKSYSQYYPTNCSLKVKSV